MTTPMYWQDDTQDIDPGKVSREIVDVAYRTRCERLPVDHAWALCSGIQAILPWIGQDERCGVHLIHVAESGNGWQRPAGEDYLVLSRRTRLHVRVPGERTGDAKELCDRRLLVGDCVLDIGVASEKLLTPSPTVFSRHVETTEQMTEDRFLDTVAEQLLELDIRPRRMLCGKLHAFQYPAGPLFARSVLIADLEHDESIKLQQTGIGNRRMFGMGLFLPHKGIEAVYTKAER